MEKYIIRNAVGTLPDHNDISKYEIFAAGERVVAHDPMSVL